MSNFVNKIAIVGTLGLAVLPWIALTSAHAQTAVVKVSDLAQGSPAQVALFESRVDQAAHKLCAGYVEARRLSQVAACKTAVRQEADEKFQAMKAGSISLAIR